MIESHDANQEPSERYGTYIVIRDRCEKPSLHWLLANLSMFRCCCNELCTFGLRCSITKPKKCQYSTCKKLNIGLVNLPDLMHAVLCGTWRNLFFDL